MNTDISEHIERFKQYTEAFCQDAQKKDMLELKILHTQYVLAHMRELVLEEEELFPNARACLLSALYHDIGRFLQFTTYGTFKDAHSVNHATLGAKILHQEGFLQHESHLVRRQVLALVSIHNRYVLPINLSPILRSMADALRDADKLDILRIMAEHFSCQDKQSSAVTFYAQDEPLLYSEKILQDVLHKRVAAYADIVYVNDFKLLLCTWIHDLTYQGTQRALLSHGYIQKILQDLPSIPALQNAKENILQNVHNMT